MDEINRFKVGDRIYYEYIGAGGQVKKIYGCIIDMWRLGNKTYVDIQSGPHMTMWPIRAELVHPDDGQQVGREVSHVLC